MSAINSRRAILDEIKLNTTEFQCIIAFSDIHAVLNRTISMKVSNANVGPCGYLHTCIEIDLFNVASQQNYA